jgi:hypothetical protein
MGSAMGYGVVMAVKAISDIALTPIINEGQIQWLIPVLIGLLFYAKFIPGLDWVPRYPTALLVGLGSALSMRVVVRSRFISQITSTFVHPFSPPYQGNPPLPINNIVIIIIVIVTLLYFIFSGGEMVQKSVFMANIRKLAIYFMLFAFGAGFANTVVTRLALWVGRTRFLIQPTSRPILPFVLLIMFVVLVWDDIKKYIGR